MKRPALLVFARVPEPGQVKTRLQQRYAPEDVAALYGAFIADTHRLVSAVDIPSRWYMTEPAYRDQVALPLPVAQDEAYRQQGDSLGERLRDAFRDTFEAGHDAAVVIGTDSPNLPERYVRLALAALERHRVVVGPASDGGFYLLGLRGVAPDFFSELRYSRSDVFEKLQAIMKARGLRPYVLPEWYDVDRPEDLDRLASDLAEHPESAPETARTLQSLSAGRPL